MRDPRNGHSADDPRPDPDDEQAAIDRAFAELVAEFNRSTDEFDRSPDLNGSADGPNRSADMHRSADPFNRPADPQPDPQHDRPAPEPLPPLDFGREPEARPEPDSDEREERYVPPPAPPLPRPTGPLAVGWIGIAYAVVAMFLLAFGVPLPRWAGWIAVVSFLGGLALLLSQLPRHRPPDDDGARL